MVTRIAATPGPHGGENISDHPGQTLGDALRTLGGDPPCSMPLVVKLLENPASPIALPGNIDLYRHDCLHLLLNRGFSLDDEAFVIGFTMGNDKQTNRLHLALFKLCSWLLYPKPYRFSWAHFKSFDRGVGCGRSVRSKNLNRFDFKVYEHKSLDQLRQLLGIDQLL
jgi:hypothetical protein